jgi:hypothetical protein
MVMVTTCIIMTSIVSNARRYYKAAKWEKCGKEISSFRNEEKFCVAWRNRCLVMVFSTVHVGSTNKVTNEVLSKELKLP